MNHGNVAPIPSTSTTELIGAQLGKLQSNALIMLVVGAVLCGIEIAMGGGINYFFHSYLFAALFWMGICGGSLGLLMLHHVVGGGWGFLIRPFIEAATRILWLPFLFFIPILVLPGTLYPWAHRDLVAHDRILQIKSVFLNPGFFAARTVLYFAIWGILAYFLNKWGAQQHERDDAGLNERLNNLGAAGLVIFVVTTTISSVDWVLTLTPHYYSSIIGFLFVVMQGLSTFAIMMVLLGFLVGNRAPLNQVPLRYFRDLGNLTMAFVLMWAYMSFSQWLLNYSGNSREEAMWYVIHTRGGWGWVSLMLIPFHFALPFVVLQSGVVKTDPMKLARLGLYLVMMRLIDLFWWVMPSYTNHFRVSWSDFGAPLLLGGIWLWVWAQQVQGRPIVPAHDPRLLEHWDLEKEPAHG